jgi:hypothetical protein
MSNCLFVNLPASMTVIAGVFALSIVSEMAPRNSPDLTMIYDQEKLKGNANRATLAVARKLVAYLIAVDRRQKGSLQ